jgi:hypothetical protein
VDGGLVRLVALSVSSNSLTIAEASAGSFQVQGGVTVSAIVTMRVLITTNTSLWTQG